MRALILGGTGMLGRAVVHEARRRGHAALGLSREQADITDLQRLEYWVGVFRPDWIVNCAAFTQVDACEEQRERAFEVNGRAVGHVVEAARAAGARLLHLSTDYVFDGRAARPYREDDEPAPRSVYGASKLEGERCALAYPEALVLRVSWLFGPEGANFVRTILGLVERGQSPLRVVDDQIGCPTYTPFVARALWDLASLDLAGVIHFRNREPVSWYDFAREITGLWDRNVEVLPVTTAEFPRPAPRPAYSVLDVGRCETVLCREVEPWGWGLAEYLTSLRSRRSP